LKNEQTIPTNFTHIAFKYMFKFFLAFFLVFSTSVMVFQVAKNNLERYILDRVQLQINNGILSISDTVEKLELISQILYQNEGFSELAWEKNTTSSAERALLLRQNKELLKSISSVSDYTTYSFVLFRQNNLFLSSTQCSTSLSDYYGHFISLALVDREITDSETLKEALFDNYKNGHSFLKLTSLVYTDVNGKEQLTDPILFLTDGILSLQSSRQLFCFTLSKEYLVENILMPEISENGFLIIQNKSTGEVLLSHGTIPEALSTDTPQNGQYKFGGYHITTRIKNQLGWQITAGFPTSYISDQLAPVQTLLMTYLGLGLFIVILLTFYFSMARYRGLQKVFLSIPRDAVISPNQKHINEYNLLSRNFSALAETRDSYRQRAEELKRQNQAILFENILTKVESTGQEHVIFQELFSRELDFYNIVIVRLSQPQDTQANDNISIDMMDFLADHNINLLYNIRSDFFDELFLIELSFPQEENIQMLISVFDSLAKVISDKYSCILHIGISSTATQPSDIKKCYAQAKQLVQSQYSYENENIVSAHDATVDVFSENPVTLEFLTRLYNNLICGRFENSASELDQLETYYQQQPYLYELHKAQIFYSLKNLFHTAMLHLNCDTQDHSLPTYTATISCPKMIVSFKDSAEWLSHYIDQGKKQRNEVLKGQILDYLNANYQNPDLSAYIVSQAVGISEKYLYPLFKAQTGETFSSYLLRLRIEKAQEYLEKTDYSNKEIAELTGFSSSNTFYRNFQKLVGITPKMYKEKVIKQ